MSISKSILYGIVSGITEFLPVSSRAHQALLHYMFGTTTRNSLQELLVHIGLLLSVFVGCREILFRLKREQRESRFNSKRRRRKGRSPDAKSYYDLRLLKTASFPLLIGLVLRFAAYQMDGNMLNIMLFLAINGFLLLLADHARHGNRDARTMSGLDGIVMGILGAFSAFPGISRTGIIASYGTLRGADSENASNWAILLAIPAILFAMFFDVFLLFNTGVGDVSFSAFGGWLLSGVGAFCGGYFSISALKTILNHSGFTPFAYYSIGASLFSFILYLIT